MWKIESIYTNEKIEFHFQGKVHNFGSTDIGVWKRYRKGVGGTLVTYTSYSKWVKYKITIPLLTLNQIQQLQKWFRYNSRLLFSINNLFQNKEGYIHSIDQTIQKAPIPDVDLFDVEMTIIVWESEL